jgi:hypothetical protein
MDSIFIDVCVLVTAAFAVTLVPGLRQPERSLLSRRDQGTALLVFLVLGLVEEATVSNAGLLNERIVAACAAVAAISRRASSRIWSRSTSLTGRSSLAMPENRTLSGVGSPLA